MFETYQPYPVWPKQTSCYNFNKLFDFYIILMGMMGFFLSAADILAISKDEQLPICMKRTRIRGYYATPREERDLKLIAATLTSFFYMLLSFGVYYEYVLCAYPYLIMQSLIISGEILIFLIRLNNNYMFNINKEDIFCALFALFNWKVVFMYLQRLAMDPNCCFP